MRIGKNTVVSLTYVLAHEGGDVIERTDEPISYLHGGYQGIFPLVEAALDGQGAGYRCSVTLAPAQAFGEYDEDLVRKEPRSAFPKDIEVGMQFRF